MNYTSDDVSLTVRRSPKWMSAWVGDELMMMSGESGAYLSLSESGGRIWELLDKSKSTDTLCAELAAEYNITPEAARPDLMHFIEQMLEERTIETSFEPSV